MRGETEKALIFQALDSGEPIDTSPENLLGDEVLGGVVANWNEAAEAIVYPVTEQPEDLSGEKLEESIERGRELFYTVKANCFSCHGYAARGDGVTNDYDHWNKMVDEEWTGIGALPKRNIKPRNLRDGVFRGGRRPLDIYRRIYAGINGTPMPAAKASLVNGEDDQAIWDLVNYVRNLPYELEPLPDEKEIEGAHRARAN
jgi:mono/diheme cytochrome c family protein